MLTDIFTPIIPLHTRAVSDSLRALLDRVSVRFDATYDDRGYSSGWVGNVRLAQNYPQAVQYVSAPAVSYQQQVQEVDGGNVSVGVAGGGYQVMGYDAFGVAIYVSPSYPGWFWYHNQWGRQAPIARYNNSGGYGNTYRQGPNTSGGLFNPAYTTNRVTAVEVVILKVAGIVVVEITMATPKAEMVAVAVVMVTINQEILRLAGSRKWGRFFIYLCGSNPSYERKLVQGLPLYYSFWGQGLTL